MYLHQNIINHEVIVCLYIDNMLIMSRNIDDINNTNHMPSSIFDIKDIEIVDLLLEIKIHKTLKGLALPQSHYIERVLHRFNYLNFNITKL